MGRHVGVRHGSAQSILGSFFPILAFDHCDKSGAENRLANMDGLESEAVFGEDWKAGTSWKPRCGAINVQDV